MPRPRKERYVKHTPGTTYFKPAGIPKRELEEVVLEIGEFEAIRLADERKMTQQAAAKEMKVSQPTFNRILSSARNKVADAIINGKSIAIHTKEVST